jgi:cob(I)alamin adenosyltransferase
MVPLSLSKPVRSAAMCRVSPARLACRSSASKTSSSFILSGGGESNAAMVSRRCDDARQAERRVMRFEEGAVNWIEPMTSPC